MVDDELIDRARRGEATDAELAELAAWRQASPDNERQHRATLRLLDAARSLGHTETSLARPSAAEIIARTASRRRFTGATIVARWTPWVIAAAAALVAAVALRSRTTDAGAIPGWGSAEVVTGATELATVQLGEGSVVRLAPSSRLRVLAGRERAVHLEGRAFFAVERMPQRPLRIHTAAGDARVLGTRFELATNADHLELRVVEGTVALSTPRQRVQVAAGQETTITGGTVARPTPVPALAAVATWVGKFLAFQATPLREAAREIERVYGTPVAITDSALARETITATFTDRPVREVVNVVCSVLNAHCTVEDNHVRIDR
jgi:ferric-dicitrate binding protein FerR (iron transport regulator)